MKIIGIIAEYNPFHLGHLYQINKIKEMLETGIVEYEQEEVPVETTAAKTDTNTTNELGGSTTTPEPTYIFSTSPTSYNASIRPVVSPHISEVLFSRPPRYI